MTSGLILAAGDGTRFGDGCKLLAELDGRPLLEHAVRAASAVAELERVVVVLGADAAEIQTHVEFDRAEVVVCDDWMRGQAASLQCGLDALATSTPGTVIVTLGDAPLITPEVIARFVDAPPGTRAVYDGRPGHPVVLGAEHVLALRSLTGDYGARDLLRGAPTIECADLCSGRDVDTLEDLDAIRDEARAVL